MTTDNLFPTVYTAFHRKSDMVRCHLASWRVGDDYAFRSAEEAWRHEVDVCRACRRPRPDPADFIVVSGALTNDVDKHGSHLVVADWQHTYDPQSFYEEVERERQLAEKREVAHG